MARTTELDARNAALLEREVLLTAVADASRLLLESNTLANALTQALERIGRAARWDRTQLRISAPNADGAMGHEVVAEWVAEGVQAQLGSATHGWIADSDVPDLAAIIRGGQSFWLTFDELSPAAQQLFGAIGIQTTVAVPIFVDGTYAGIIGFDDCAHARPRQAHELDALTTAARVIAAAMHRERLVDAVVQERERAAGYQVAELAKANEILRGTVATLAGGGGIESFVGSVTREAARVVDAVTGVVFLYEPVENAFRLAAGCDDGRVCLDVQPSARVGRELLTPADLTPVWRTLLAQDGPLLIHAVSDPVNTWPHAVAMHRALGHASIGYLRLQVGDRPLGFLGLGWRTLDPVLAPDHVAVLVALGQQLALALELNRLSQAARADAAQAAVLEERTRIAREMHDTIAQGLAGVVMQLDRVRAKLGDAAAPAAPELGVIDRLARDSLAEARRSLAMLRPSALEADGLVQALEAAVGVACPQDDATDRPPAIATLDVRGHAHRLPPDVEMELLRIAQAALANACQHAAASVITVDLGFERGGCVRVSVTDDGRGFDPTRRTPGRFGLTGMSERAARIGATLAIVTAPGEGTQIVARWEPR
ncbi:MAG TPA: GAF domain-containing sensor histidine kinase [Gemmatimonas sp.]|nr:GAF domain-containing sensor histidine kinase [Gemmatimonas sp.]